MSDNLSLEVDYKFIEKLFELADLQGMDKIELKDMDDALEIIRKKLNKTTKQENDSAEIELLEDEKDEEEDDEDDGGNFERPKNVLIVDDLGIVTLQLETLFKKFGFNVTKSKDPFDAISKYKSQDFGYAVLDLFIPTEREGFILLDEIKKLSILSRLNSKIIVMSASNKKEHKEKCMSKGANIFIEKNQGWQEKIIDIVMQK